MRVFHTLTTLPPFRYPVLTVGSFDGIHAGHQQLIQRINQLAHEQGGESIIVTFHPHPRYITRPHDAPPLLTTLSEKIRLLDEYGVDNLVVVPFTQAFARQSAEAYICDFLTRYFAPRCIVIGYDHRFGNNREGDLNYLRRFEAQCGFNVLEISKHQVEDIAVSSTKIREALLRGEVKKAAQLLKHPYLLAGKVVHGEKIGTRIGYPTANLLCESPHKLLPPDGIYAVKVEIAGQWHGGMLYIGKRPTVGSDMARTIEVNIFDFSGDLYGQFLTLQLLDRIRGDLKFNSLEALSRQLAADQAAALHILYPLQP